jgi:putative ABC transport system permease protein
MSSLCVALMELKIASRSLLRQPGFTAVAVLTLALGIGLNTAIFSVVQAVLLRPLPFPRPGELVALNESLPASGSRAAEPEMAITPPTTRDWSKATTLASMGFYAESDYILTGAGEPARIPGADVSPGFFPTLGVEPVAGRLLTPDDDVPNAPPVCVIAHELWASRFGSDASLIGKSIELSGRPHTVVGVMPASFEFPETARIWTPLALPTEEFADDQRLSFYLRGVGRLRASATPVQVEAELTSIANGLASRFPDRYRGRGATVRSLHESSVTAVRPALMLLLGTAGCVLLIACVNVANLLFARTASRTGELATRVALGASRGRILKQLLTESAVLSACGAIGGVLLALWARDAIVALSPANVPRIDEVRVDGAVLGFALLAATVTMLAIGLLPAILSSRRALQQELAGGRKGIATGGRQWVRGSLVVAQLALSLALLTGAGLLARTFWNLISVDTGFNADQVTTMEVLLPRPKYQDPARRADLVDRVVSTLQSNPLVQAAGGTTNLPLSNTNMSFMFYTEGMTPDKDVPYPANLRAVTNGYFAALQIPVVRGRAIGAEDRFGSPPVVVVNDAMRRKYWPNTDPIGQRISITRGRTVVWREIVGIVGDIRHAGLSEEPAPEIYMPYAHDPFFFVRVAVRSSGDPSQLAGAMRAAVWAVDPAQPVSRVRSMNDVIATSIAAERFNTILIGTFALLALVLAAVGLYGIVAHSVTLRFHEFGVRVALGARRRHVLGLVLRQALLLATIGIGLGMTLAFGVTRLLETQLYGTTARDPLTFAAVAGLLLGVVLLASLVPARRAISVDPIRALRAE